MRLPRVLCTACALVMFSGTLLADGMMRPATTGYPWDFLRHRMTKVEVTIIGQIALTTVYQEFVNEWYLPTDAVYSFPLPLDARATDFFFWSNDTLFRAPLKVKEQSPNPGTGEGGIDALLNRYLGDNAIRVLLRGVPPGEIQRVRLDYISLCSCDGGALTYRFPLNSSQFLTYPLETFALSVKATATDDITADTLTGIDGAYAVSKGNRQVLLTCERSKLYLTRDLTFSYSTANSTLGYDLYSVANDTMDGHFVFMLKPPVPSPTGTILPKSVTFLLDHSSSTAGATLEGSKEAIKECLRHLNAADLFNVIAFNSWVSPWAARSVPVTGAAIDSASRFVDMITASGGSDMASALQDGIASIGTDTMNCVMLLFSDGRAPVDPAWVRSINTANVGIFPIAISDNVGRSRLAMIAYLNFGFPTFLAATDPVYEEILRLFSQVSSPVLRDTRMEMGSNAYDLLPGTLHTVYSGSRFYLTGRYKAPGATALSIAGYSANGAEFHDFSLDLTSDRSTYPFAEKFWAKEKIDELERQVDVYGETDSLKQLLIRISLGYGIRCKYTAYIADKSQPTTSVTDATTVAGAPYELLGNYPNPFNPGTTIRFLVRSGIAGTATVRIYNVIGQLVNVLRVQVNGSGQYQVSWDGTNERGGAMPSGVYYYTVELRGRVLSGKMILLR